MDKEIILKKKILVIEDDSHIKQYLVSLLKDHGYDVYEAGRLGPQILSPPGKNP